MKRPSLSQLVLGTVLIAAVGCGDRAVVVGHVRGESAPGGGSGGGLDEPEARGGAGSTAPDAPSARAGSSGGAARSPFILGADLSWVDEQEDSGISFVDRGVEADILEILASHGFNFVRLRLFVDPSAPCRISESGDTTCGYQFEGAARAEPYCDLAHTLAMARRVKTAGMGLLLDFHYSDTWADPDDQNKPLAWEGLSFDELVEQLKDYTRNSLAAFRDADVEPDIVQLGNEITPGMLYPDGSSGEGRWDDFVTLLQAAITGAREACPSTRVMLHIEKPESFETSDWWLSNVLARNIEFDILGQSCYPEWHGPAEGWPPTFALLAAKYPDLDFLVAEYSQEKRAVNDMMWALPDGRGLGSFIWEPTGYGEALFNRVDNQLVASDLLTLYDQMAEDYGLQD